MLIAVLLFLVALVLLGAGFAFHLLWIGAVVVLIALVVRAVVGRPGSRR